MTIGIKGVNVKPTHHALLRVLKHLKQTDDKTLFRFKLMSLLFRTINVIALEGKSKEVFDRYVQHRAKTMEFLHSVDELDVMGLLDKPLRAFLESSKVMQYCNGELDEISPTVLLQEVLATPNKEIDQLMLDVLKNIDYEGDVPPDLIDPVCDKDTYKGVYAFKHTRSEDDFAGDTLTTPNPFEHNRLVEEQCKQFITKDPYETFISLLDLFLKNYSKLLTAGDIDQLGMLMHRNSIRTALSRLPHPLPSHLVDLIKELDTVGTPEALLAVITRWQSMRLSERVNKDYWGGIKVRNPNEGDNVRTVVLTCQDKFDFHVKQMLKLLNNIRIGLAMAPPTYYKSDLSYVLLMINQLSTPLLKRVFDLQTKLKKVNSRSDLIGVLMDYVAIVKVDSTKNTHTADVVEFKPKKD